MKAERQAIHRAAVADLKASQLVVLMHVFSLTTTYSRLADRVSASQVVPESWSRSAAARAVARLARLGILAYQPGNGRGRLSIVGVPPEGEKGGLHRSDLSAREGSEHGAVFRRSEGRSVSAEKVGAHAGARPRASELGSKKRNQEENVATPDGAAHSLAVRWIDTRNGRVGLGPGVSERDAMWVVAIYMAPGAEWDADDWTDADRTVTAEDVAAALT